MRATVVPHTSVKQGAPKPDISTVEAFKQTLLNAKAIAEYLTSPMAVSVIKANGMEPVDRERCSARLIVWGRQE